MRYREKWPQYRDWLNTMGSLETAIKPNRVEEIRKYALFAIQNKARYQEVERSTGVPWYKVACLHRRESDCDFNTYLGNGDPLNRVSVHDPAGRGPFPTFLAGCIDALAFDGLDKVVPPWPVEKLCYWDEVFNGQGYHNKGLPSPYVWGATFIQKPGKYVSDGVFDASTWDTQPGTAAIYWMIGYLDPSVRFTRET